MIRTVRLDDAEELLRIYSYYVENTAITFEYDVPTVDEFRKRIETITEKYPYFVYEGKWKNNRILHMQIHLKIEQLMTGRLR